MNTLEIDKCLKTNKNTKKIYKETFASNEFPLKKFRKKVLFVLNTQPSWMKGEHWVVIYINKKNLEFFDSAGRDLSDFPSFKKILIFYSDKKILSNKIQIQTFSSDICGEISCLFCLAKSRNLKIKEFVNYFNKKNLYDNNHLVIDYFKKNFNCGKIVCSNNYKNIKNKKIQICTNLRSIL